MRPQYRRLGLGALRWAAGFAFIAVIGGMMWDSDAQMLSDGPPYVDEEGDEMSEAEVRDSLATDRWLVAVFGPASLALAGAGTWRYFRGGVWEKVDDTDDTQPLLGFTGEEVSVDDLIKRVEREQQLATTASSSAASADSSGSSSTRVRLERQHRAFEALADISLLGDETVDIEASAYESLREDLHRLAVISQAVDADPRSRPTASVQRTIQSLRERAEEGVRTHDELVMAATALLAESAASDHSRRDAAENAAALELRLKTQALREVSGLTDRILGTDADG